MVPIRDHRTTVLTGPETSAPEDRVAAAIDVVEQRLDARARPLAFVLVEEQRVGPRRLTHVRGFRPTNPRTHVRRGRRSLCGATAELTQTHVPPRAAFNTGRSRRFVVNEANEMTLDNGRDGGIRIWGHCEACRSATSLWDDEYIKWANCLVAPLVSSPRLGQRSSLSGTFTDARPGRFVRAALSGMTSLAEGLLDSHPDLVGVVRAGQPWTSADDMRFLAAVTPVVEPT